MQDNSMALSFLEKWAPTGFWVLTAIEPDSRKLVTRTFNADSKDMCRQFLEEHNGERNLYFSVNQPATILTKKATREDIHQIEWLHVDIDPPNGVDIQVAQEKALGMLTINRPENIPYPTCIIFSGGGYQAFWKLAEPILVEGSIDKAEEMKLYNMQLERVFKGDNCHNVDRIMRLPGTTNIPNARKREKGRVPVMASLYEFNDHSYPLTSFIKAQAVQNSKLDTGNVVQVSISGNIPRTGDLSELDKWHVPDRVKVIITNGNHPDPEEQQNKKDKGDNSRSAWLFDAVCGLMRCEVPAEVIYGIITDPIYAISDSVLELGSNADRYAKRQIERAQGFLQDPDLQNMNDKYAFIKRYGSKARIVHEFFNEELGRHDLAAVDINSFRLSYNNIKKQVGESQEGKPIFAKLGDWWLGHPNRKTYERVVFYPGKDAPGCYNLWKGFACEAIPGDCSLFLTHLRENVCQNNEAHYEYLVKWFARMFQYPAEPGQVALVLRGGQGVGKSFVASIVGSLLGRHYMAVSDSRHLVGNFNAHSRSCLLLFADEAFYAGDKKHESSLKTVITEKYRAIEAKGVDVEQAPNFLHLILASNNEWVVPAGDVERRFFVLDVGAAQQQNTTYFSAIKQQMDSGGREALLHFFLSYNLADFNVWQVPMTTGLVEQKDFTLKPEESWWLDCLEMGEVEPGTDRWPVYVAKNSLYEHYINYCDQRKITWGRLSHIAFGKKFNKLALTAKDKQYYTKDAQGTNHAAYRIYPLADCREHWEKVKGKRVWTPIIPFEEELYEEHAHF